MWFARALFFCSILALTAAAATLAAVPHVGTKPALIVVLVVDQMRAEYIERFGHAWGGGLKRLLTQGAWFRRATYAHLNTVTCAGHATIATGAYPATHGVIMNQWYNRATGDLMVCTYDPQAPAVSVGGSAAGGHSATWLAVPTLADELRAQDPHGARVVTLSLKTRSAVMLAGHGGTVLWQSPSDGAWATSQAFEAPAPGITTFLARHTAADDFGKAWTKLLSASEYRYAPSTEWARPPGTWTTAWPHVLKGTGETPDAAFYDMWQRSPYSDEYLGRLAAHAVDVLQLGRRGATDYLGVGFSALDLIGHKFGDTSHEVQDVLARVDRTIGTLLAYLDAAIGRDRYVVALSSDHGVSPIPEEVAGSGVSAGRVDRALLERRIDEALTPYLGEGPKVARQHYTDTYFRPGVYERVKRNPEALDRVIDAMLTVPGVWRVFTADELERGRDSRDAVTRAAALSYFRGRSGDLVSVPRPYWINSLDPITHGTSHRYDADVPVILLGAPFRAGVYLTESSPADIAPTLGFVSGTRLAQPDGRVLVEALAPQGATSR